MNGKEVDWQAIANIYDMKILGGLNELLARVDKLSFNHNGLFLPGESIDMYRERITDEETVLQVLHEMEKNLVRFGGMYLGDPTEEMLGLDAGCGGGGATIMLHEEYGSSIEGFTLSPEQVNYARVAAEHYGYSKEVQFFEGNMLELPRPDNMYDFIWACESTEHISDLHQLFQEFARVGRPSTRLVVMAVTAHNSKTKQRIDDVYLTCLHDSDEYYEASKQAGWKLAAHVDLSDMAEPYWVLRKESENATGIEQCVNTGWRNGAFQYHLFAFDLQR